jgi:hypothetical protein
MSKVRATPGVVKYRVMVIAPDGIRIKIIGDLSRHAAEGLMRTFRENVPGKEFFIESQNRRQSVKRPAPNPDATPETN